MTEVQATPERTPRDAVSAVPQGAAGARSLTVIEPPRGWWRSLDLRGLWRQRELLFFLAWRDIKIRYRQTILGGLWAVLQPVMMMLVFGLFFGRLAGLGSDGVPYAVFALAALVPWTLFATTVRGASDSLVKSEALVSKVYFPRLLLPTGAALSFLLDFVLAFVVLLGIMLAYNVYPSERTILAPAFVLLAFASALGIGTFLAAVNVRYRDVAYVVPFLVQLWLFASPVGYSTSIVPEPWRTFYGLNPMAGAVEGFRWAMTGTNTPPSVLMISLSALMVVVMLVGAVVYFKRTERTFADVI